MKLRIIPWFILLALLVTEYFGQDYYEYYPGAMTIAKKLMLNDHTYSPIGTKTIRTKGLVCRESWLYFIRADHDIRVNNSRWIKSLMTCSELYVSMLSKLYPENLELANLAVWEYPNEVTPYYWVINATDPSLREIPKGPVEKILSINPKEGLAWRYMGLIYLKEGNIPAAIDAHIQSCYNGDPGSNGCYNAGRLYEQIGDYQNAIKYYSFSKNEGYRANADHLEAELSSQNP